jgi:hypothetical protein
MKHGTQDRGLSVLATTTFNITDMCVSTVVTLASATSSMEVKFTGERVITNDVCV